jgi:type IV fimbrial biogenesis protein FimT
MRNDDASRSPGFTLVELLMTIGLASVLLALAVPSFNSFIVGSRVTTEANEMIAAIHFARSEAIKRNGSISFCRAASATATSCAAASGHWENWIVRAEGGNVVRRGVLEKYANTIVVESTLVNDVATFGPDGLGRTGGALLNDHALRICTTRRIERNVRRVILGAASRISTESISGAC